MSSEISELEHLIKKYARDKRLTDVVSLGFIRWDQADPKQSAWPQLYRMLAQVTDGQFLTMHTMAYAAPDVMKVMLTHQKRYFKLRRPSITAEELRRAVSWSNLDQGPMEGKWIPKGRILVTVEV